MSTFDMQPPAEATELEPYVVCRAVDGSLQLALWQLTDGRPAVALFRLHASATEYRRAAELDDTWQVRRPGKNVLLEIFKSCRAGGIELAVLDPDSTGARQMFDLSAVVRAAE